MKQYISYLPGFLISLIFLIITSATLSDYGMHEDSPFHYLRGQAYLQLFLDRKAKFDLPQLPSPVLFVPGQLISEYKPNASETLGSPIRPAGNFQDIGTTFQKIHANLIEKTGKRDSFYKHNSWNADYWDRPDQGGHPPVSDILMSLSNRLFYQKLGLLSDIESYHFYIVITSSLCLFFLFLFTNHAFGKIAAIFACMSLALFPFYFAESHFNIKDPVQMNYFTIAIVSFYFWTVKKFKIRWFILFIISSFLAFGTKWNIAFIPLIILPWFVLMLLKTDIGHETTLPRLSIYALLAIIVPFLLLIISWPLLWTDTIGRIINTFYFYVAVGFKPPNVDISSKVLLPFGFDSTAILRVISMTPIASLVLFAIGLFSLLLRRVKFEYKEGWLLLFWLLVPILRSSRQEVDIGGGIRNFMEYLPAFATISAVGGAAIIDQLVHLKKSVKFKRLITVTVCLIYIIILSSNIIKLHPNENIYYNLLFGRLKGAYQSGFLYDWQGSYDNVYRQGVNWLNQHVGQNAKLAYLDGTMLSISPIWLRDDIRFGSSFSGFNQKGEYIISLVYPNPPNVFAFNYLDRFLNPIYELKVDGVTLLKIWQNDPKFTKPGYSSSHYLSKDLKIEKLPQEKRLIWQIRLSTRSKVTKLIIKVPVNNCTNHKGIWSTQLEGKETFWSLNNYFLQGDLWEVDFPAEMAEAIRFWDVEGNSCIYDAQLDQIYAL